MGEARYYRVADLVLKIQVDGEHIGFSAPEWTRWNPFACDPGPLDLELWIDEAEKVAPAGVVGHRGPAPVMEWTPPSVHRFYRWGFDVVVEEGPVTTCRGRVDRFFHNLDAAFRLPVALVMARRATGLLLHASAVAGEQGAVVLTGPPGVGKSTAAANRPSGSSFLSDEIVAVFWQGSALMAGSTPFGGDLDPGGGRSLVKALFRLEQGLANEIEELDLRSAVAVLLRGAVVATMDPQLLGNVLRCAERMAAASRIGRLSARKDGSFWTAVL